MNHDSHIMRNNHIDEYELVNGYAVVDNNFTIVTANEPMYLFLGMSMHFSIMDSIHQVDLDDFVDVANSLRPGIKKSMCIRMRRIDNSYRWVIVDIEKRVIPNTDSSEYLELHISDVLVIRELNKNYSIRLTHLKIKLMKIKFTNYAARTCHQRILFKNIEADNNCELSLIYLEVDNFEQFKATHTDDEFHRITYVIEDTILKAIDGRGLLGRLDDFKYIIAIKNINNEVKLRAFWSILGPRFHGIVNLLIHHII